MPVHGDSFIVVMNGKQMPIQHQLLVISTEGRRP
jgi:hypothetical protein